MGKYYYLIAGLADISLDDSKAPASLESLREELYEALDAADRRVMDMLLLENDCRNLLSALSALSTDSAISALSASENSALSADSARNSSLFSEEQ